MSLHPGYAPIYAISALSIAGWLCVLLQPNPVFDFVLFNRWSLQYLAVSPFFHASLVHVFFNLLMLHFIGGQMALPLLGARRFVMLFAVSVLAGGVVNTVLADNPAIGISGAVMAMLSFSLFRFAYVPVKLLLIHDLLRLNPFPLWKVAAFLVAMDILGLIFGWGFFPHWAHLTGFACGGVAGWLLFVRRRGGGRSKSSGYTIH